MRKIVFLVFMAGLGLLAGCSRLTVDNSAVSELDVQRFLGTWHEIARFDHRFERGMEQTKATYVLRDDGYIDVLNTGIKERKLRTAEGKAKLTDEPAVLRVSFFGPFYSDYRVMLIDSAYQYALIGSSSDDYLWILSRTPQLSDSIRDMILSEVKQRGYDTRQLIWVKQ